MMKKKRTVFKSAAIGIAAIATSLSFGLGACSNGGNNKDDDDDTTITRVDEQKIKNGNFEYYSNNKGLYPISSPNNWTYSNSGNSSSSMSGIIDTNKARWEYITDPELPKTLEANDDLKSDDKNKKDYNGALTDDMPYVNTHKAIESDAKDEDKKYIPNPLTHGYKYNENGEIVDDNGNVRATYTDEEGRIYFDEAHEQPANTSVLMIHNYRRSYYTGTEAHYTSSSTITLEASTACEISLWVKTAELYFDGTKAERTKVESERGAYIQVASSVGGNSVDNFSIKNIDTEALNPDKNDNGWVKYTVYVQASTFADTTVTLTLGLGESDIYTVEGYAFFDDVTFTQYDNVAAMEDACSDFNDTNLRDEDTSDRSRSANVYYPLSPDATGVFRTDKESHKTNKPDGSLTDPVADVNNFDDRHFYINFATGEEDELHFNSDTVRAGLTVEKTATGNYVSAKPAAGEEYSTTLSNEGLNNGADKAYLPNALRPNGLSVKGDLIATTTIGADWTFTCGGDSYRYAKTLTEALKSAATLPNAPEAGADTLVIMSGARGASYEARISDDRFSLKGGENAVVSFWLKNSAMGDKTAATVSVYEEGNETNSASFTLDSTTQNTVTVNGKEDAYDGWVKCFVRVGNVSKDKENAKNFVIKINYGATTIKGTTATSYKSGWLAITNASVMKVDNDVYGYTSGVSNNASLTFEETQQRTQNNFDSELGSNNVIKTDLAVPSSYTGVNGASAYITTEKTSVQYDATNDNKTTAGVSFTGLLNSAYVEQYKDKAWYSSLLNKTGVSTVNAADAWKQIFGESSSQPLLIHNTPRNFGDGGKIYNYGYIGGKQTVSANGYVAVSVRVKVTAGGIANIYLVENTEAGGSKVLSYELPAYNFWYDDDGNILKGEPDPDALTNAEKKKNIAYSVRKDGLYSKEGDSKLYANLYNLTKYYDSAYEHADFFDENGNRVHYKNIVQGETYYANRAKTAYAPHHLIAGGEANSKVYEYREGVNGDACYYYMENGKANKSKTVYNISTADAKLRYENPSANATPYQFTIDTNTSEGAKYANKWVTATFYVHAGSEEKSFKLELWSGRRDEKSSYATNDESFVMFDYNSISLDQTTYDGLVEAYVNDITAEYRELLSGTELSDNDLTIAELEKLAGNKSTLYSYIASYYAFSLYDMPTFIPFNGETAHDSDSGYSFKYSESAESLTFLKVADDGAPVEVASGDGVYTLSAFIDYSVVDKDIEIIGKPTPPDNSDNNNNNNNNGDGANVWLLAASIALIAAMFVAAAAIFIRYLVKKLRRSKTAGKNTYNFNKNKRYVKQYVKANGEAPEVKPVEEGEVDESLLTDKTDAEESAESGVDGATERGENAESTESAGEKTTSADNSEDEAKGDGNPDEEPKGDGENGEKPDGDNN